MLIVIVVFNDVLFVVIMIVEAFIPIHILILVLCGKITLISVTLLTTGGSRVTMVKAPDENTLGDSDPRMRK